MEGLGETHLQSVEKHQAEAHTAAVFHFTRYFSSTQQMQPEHRSAGPPPSRRQGCVQGRRRITPSSLSLATPLLGTGTEGLLGSGPAQDFRTALRQFFQQGSESSCFLCILKSLSCCLTAGSLLLQVKELV